MHIVLNLKDSGVLKSIERDISWYSNFIAIKPIKIISYPQKISAKKTSTK